MSGDGIRFSGVSDVLPKLLTVREPPTVGALVDGDNELLRSLKEFEEISFSSFQRLISCGSRLASKGAMEQRLK